MIHFVPIALVVLLSFQVFPVALGITARENFGKAVLPVIILASTQVVLFLAGYYLGRRFLYLLQNHASSVLFAGFFIIGIRMMMEVLKIRRGQRLYELKHEKGVFLIAIAQSVNTFLAGLLFFFIPLNIVTLSAILLIASLVMSLAGAFSEITKMSLAFASLLYLIAGILIIVSSVYFIFAAFISTY